jgi:hypothetical protein
MSTVHISESLFDSPKREVEKPSLPQYSRNISVKLSVHDRTRDRRVFTSERLIDEFLITNPEPQTNLQNSQSNSLRGSRYLARSHNSLSERLFDDNDLEELTDDEIPLVRNQNGQNGVTLTFENGNVESAVNHTSEEGNTWTPHESGDEDIAYKGSSRIVVDNQQEEFYDEDEQIYDLVDENDCLEDEPSNEENQNVVNAEHSLEN